MMWLGALLLAAGVAGCGGPIEAWRSLSGANKNQPDPATTPFTENLDKSETGGYANLASVPPPPLVSTTVVDRKKLDAALITQRSSVQAPDAAGHPGSPAPGPVPPLPPIPASIAAAPPNGPVTMAAAPPPSRKMDEPPAVQPSASTQQSPDITALPGVEAPHPAPPQLGMAPMPAITSADLPPPPAAHGNPLPPPPPASLPAAVPSPAAATRPAPKLPPSAVTVLALDLPAGTAALPPSARAQLAPVVVRYEQKPGIVRVVAYAAPATGSADQLNAFRSALDRAQLVAEALIGAGIPTNKIQTQASPPSETVAAGRIEIQLLP
jgi:hypothetical protein